MRRTTVLILFFIGTLLAPGWSAGMDVIVMVDTSQSMFVFFDDVVNYLTREILKNRLHAGDTLHLLSFADQPELEVSACIEQTAEIERVVARILLLNALGRYTDLVSAVNYIYAFIRSLPKDNKKLILLLTDGIHDPPPGSPYYQMDPQQVREELLQSARRIQRKGWNVHILQMPEPDAQAAEEGGTPAITFLKDHADAQHTEPVPYDRQEEKGLQLELSAPTTPRAESAAPVSQKNRRILFLLYILIPLILLYIFIRLILLLRRRIEQFSSPHFYRPLRGTGAGMGRGYQRPIIMRVLLQNSHIGFRNIHYIPPKKSRSVGGDGSAFLIYYVPMPKKIGLIANDGKQYTFIPRREEYFSDLKEPLPDCLNREIRALSRRGHQVTFFFKEYISPAEEINNLLRSVKDAGPRGPAPESP